MGWGDRAERPARGATTPRYPCGEPEDPTVRVRHGRRSRTVGRSGPAWVADQPRQAVARAARSSFGRSLFGQPATRPVAEIESRRPPDIRNGRRPRPSRAYEPGRVMNVQILVGAGPISAASHLVDGQCRGTDLRSRACPSDGVGESRVRNLLTHLPVGRGPPGGRVCRRP